MKTHFDIFGLERRYELDLSELERRYRELSRQLHPDRFARATPQERLLAVQKTTELNDAFRVLKDETRRAEYLLLIEGIDVGDDKPRALGSVGGARAIKVDPALLMEIVELREALTEARMAGDEAKIGELTAEVQDRRREAIGTVQVGFAALAAGDRSRLDEVAQALVSMRYFARFLDEVEAHEEQKLNAVPSEA